MTLTAIIRNESDAPLPAWCLLTLPTARVSELLGTTGVWSSSGGSVPIILGNSAGGVTELYAFADWQPGTVTGDLTPSYSTTSAEYLALPDSADSESGWTSHRAVDAADFTVEIEATLDGVPTTIALSTGALDSQRSCRSVLIYRFSAYDTVTGIGGFCEFVVGKGSPIVNFSGKAYWSDQTDVLNAAPNVVIEIKHVSISSFFDGAWTTSLLTEVSDFSDGAGVAFGGVLDLEDEVENVPPTGGVCGVLLVDGTSVWDGYGPALTRVGHTTPGVSLLDAVVTSGDHLAGQPRVSGGSGGRYCFGSPGHEAFQHPKYIPALVQASRQETLRPIHRVTTAGAPVTIEAFPNLVYYHGYTHASGTEKLGKTNFGEDVPTGGWYSQDSAHIALHLTSVEALVKRCPVAVDTIERQVEIMFATSKQFHIERYAGRVMKFLAEAYTCPISTDMTGRLETFITAHLTALEVWMESAASNVTRDQPMAPYSANMAYAAQIPTVNSWAVFQTALAVNGFAALDSVYPAGATTRLKTLMLDAARSMLDYGFEKNEIGRWDVVYVCEYVAAGTNYDTFLASSHTAYIRTCAPALLWYYRQTEGDVVPSAADRQKIVELMIQAWPVDGDVDAARWIGAHITRDELFNDAPRTLVL